MAIVTILSDGIAWPAIFLHTDGAPSDDPHEAEAKKANGMKRGQARGICACQGHVAYFYNT
jgi:uncharacterized protein YegL